MIDIIHFTTKSSNIFDRPVLIEMGQISLVIIASFHIVGTTPEVKKIY
jgi:septum formation inhibitor-activating ATPase MinD